MSLKELTADLHQAAESTPFMKAVFAKTLPEDVWVNWTDQKILFYNSIELRCRVEGYLDDLPGIERTNLLYKDYKTMAKTDHKFIRSAIDYHRYTLDLPKAACLAHLYTWHMGDLFGGQMIKKIVPGSHLSLDFKDTAVLMTNLRSKLSDDMAPEARTAFEWAIKMMNELYE